MLETMMTSTHEMDNFASRERPNGARVHQYLPYLALKDGYQDSKWHLVLKYHSGLHRYIQT
jgi:hypothetical protein